MTEAQRVIRAMAFIMFDAMNRGKNKRAFLLNEARAVRPRSILRAEMKAPATVRPSFDAGGDAAIRTYRRGYFHELISSCKAGFCMPANDFRARVVGSFCLPTYYYYRRYHEVFWRSRKMMARLFSFIKSLLMLFKSMASSSFRRLFHLPTISALRA